MKSSAENEVLSFLVTASTTQERLCIILRLFQGRGARRNTSMLWSACVDALVTACSSNAKFVLVWAGGS